MFPFFKRRTKALENIILLTIFFTPTLFSDMSFVAKIIALLKLRQITTEKYCKWFICFLVVVSQQIRVSIYHGDPKIDVIHHAAFAPLNQSRLGTHISLGWPFFNCFVCSRVGHFNSPRDLNTWGVINGLKCLDFKLNRDIL